MSGQPKIALSGVHKRFGPKHVLRGIDLEIAPGESLVVIGGSGTGKSVMIKSILGIVRADEGSIRIDGDEMIGARSSVIEEKVARMGMLFQGGALFDSLKVWENVE